MNLIAIIDYCDYSDSYDIYRMHEVIAFEAASLKEGQDIVAQRVIECTMLDTEVDIRPTLFGIFFGPEVESSLNVEVFTLDDWFHNTKKNIDTIDTF